MLDLRCQLLKIAWELPYELLSHPHAREYPEELTELFHLLRALQDVEMINVHSGELLSDWEC